MNRGGFVVLYFELFPFSGLYLFSVALATLKSAPSWFWWSSFRYPPTALSKHWMRSVDDTWCAWYVACMVSMSWHNSVHSFSVAAQLLYQTVSLLHCCMAWRISGSQRKEIQLSQTLRNHHQCDIDISQFDLPYQLYVEFDFIDSETELAHVCRKETQ